MEDAGDASVERNADADPCAPEFVSPLAADPAPAPAHPCSVEYDDNCGTYCRCCCCWCGGKGEDSSKLGIGDGNSNSRSDSVPKLTPTSEGDAYCGDAADDA